jgi:predicted acetyltransferase
MQVELTRAPIEEKSVLQHLLELYSYDFSDFTGWDVNEHGLFGYRYLDHYWTDPGRVPLLIRVEGKLAGFALACPRDGEDDAAESFIAEFFVLRKYRRRGVGRLAARRVFAMFPGRWAVREVLENVTAQAFWRSVIAELTGGAFTEALSDDSSAIVQRFTSTAESGAPPA